MSFSRVLSLSSLVIIGTIFCSQGALGTVTITKEVDPPSDGAQYLLKGDKLVLGCRTSLVGHPVKWQYMDQSNATNNQTVDVINVPGIKAGEVGQIKFDSLSGKQSGKYTCTDGVSSEDYWVEVLDADSLIPRNVATQGTQDKVVLRCQQLFQNALPLIWTRTINFTDVVLNTLEDVNKTMTVAGVERGYDLTIRNKDKKRYPEKTGRYTCSINTTGLGVAASLPPVSKDVSYSSEPDVTIEGVSLSKSKSATKDEPYILPCKHNLDNEKAYLAWKFTNDTHNITLADQPYEMLANCPSDPSKKCVGNAIFSRNTELEGQESDQHIKTLNLEFPTVLEDNRGKYICQLWVEADANNRNMLMTETSVELKVKDKLAALWPFLGIVAEVVILCAIIFIYEKRRNKTVDEEDENEPMKGDNHETRGDAAVRSRK